MSFLPFNFTSGVLSKTFFFSIVEGKREVFNTQGLLVFPLWRRHIEKLEDLGKSSLRMSSVVPV